MILHLCIIKCKRMLCHNVTIRATTTTTTRITITTIVTIITIKTIKIPCLGKFKVLQVMTGVFVCRLQIKEGPSAGCKY